MALHKSRRDETERPENFVLVEETDSAGTSSGTGSGGGGKGSSTKRQRRILDAKENVYLVTLSWKGAGRVVLEEKPRGGNSATSSSTLHPNVFENALHANVCETMSEPVGRLSPVAVTSKMSPSLRRHSRNIVSNVRKFSRSFYGGSTMSSSSSSGGGVTSSLSVESNVTKIAVSTGPSSDSEIPTVSVDIDIDSDQPVVRPDVTSSSSQPSLSPTMSRSGSARKISKINLKKLKIW